MNLATRKSTDPDTSTATRARDTENGPNTSPDRNEAVIQDALKYIRRNYVATVKDAALDLGRYLLVTFFCDDARRYSSRDYRSPSFRGLLRRRGELAEMGVGRATLRNYVRAWIMYRKLHDPLRDQLGLLEDIAKAPALIAIHSFVPVRVGKHRPWDIGVLWDKDPRMPVPLIEGLRKIPNLVVGDNEPYSGKHIHDFTIDHHAEAEGLPHVSIEMRQDLVDTQAGAEHMSELLASVLGPMLSDPDLYKHWTM